MPAPPPSHEPVVADLVTPEIQQMLEQRRIGDARLALKDLLDVEIADIIAALPAELGALAFRILPRDRAADVFPHFDHDLQEALVKPLSDRQIGLIFDEMDPDDRVEFLEDADEDLVASLMALMKPEERQETEKILEYPEESVGRLATPDYLTVRPDWTVAQALQHIREHGKEAETIHTLYVVDDHGRLIDHVTLRDLVTAPSTETCQTLRRGQTVSLQATDDREQAVLTMERYDIPVLPVVDTDGTLVGIVTFDDVADVAEEEATEDILKMAGAGHALMESHSVFTSVRVRLPWLLATAITGSVNAIVIGTFQASLSQVLALAFFIPVVLGMGGNVGTQSASIVVRGLATGRISLQQFWSILRREATVGLILGMVYGVAVGAFGIFRLASNGWYNALLIGATVGVSILSSMTLGTLVAAIYPMVFERFHVDPAAASGPFVTTTTDLLGTLTYFLVAKAILGI